MPQHISFAVVIFAWLIASNSNTAQSQDVDKPLAAIDLTEANADADGPKPRPNVPTKTLGGREFWGDVLHFHEWRIQQNVFTKHYRLIDGSDTRRAWGTREQCQAALDEIKLEQRLPRMSGTGVILIHGITRSSKSMSAFREPLTKAGFHVFPFDYPSTRVEIPESADYLKQVIGSLEGIETLHIVAHSMGGIVTRAYMSQPNSDARLKRLVMIGSPNSGAELADLLSDNMNLVFKPMLGPAGQQLVTDPDGLIARLPTPICDFAVIAGGRGGNGFNPLIPGDDDGIVSVASTRLPGAADFMQVSSLHLRLLRSPEAINSAIRFLETGKLRKEKDEAPQPIPR
ncbi:MAG: alpha/beta fold hydrolase [Planctomycetia bacterium]|nr:alpha/beta fold hydrolase [Planctomycetia bacterium]